MTVLTARQVPEHLGPAAWSAILPQAPEGQSLSGDCTADFVIVGAGFAGLCAARRLLQLQPDARVVVLDAGRIADGAAGRNSGFMIDLPHELTSQDYRGTGDDAQQIALNRQAIAFARDAVAEYQIDPAYFDPAGKINGAVSDAAQAHNVSYAKHLHHLGESHEVLDAQTMYDITGSRHYASGLFTPGTVMLQPAGYVRGLAAGLRAKAQIYENTPVLKVARQGGDWDVTTPAGVISTGRVILTVNGHLESFGFAKGRLMQLFLFASMTPNLTEDNSGQVAGQPRWGVTPSDPMGTTMRRIDAPQGGDRIVTRTCAVLRPDMKATPADLKRAAAVQRAKFADRYPHLKTLKMEYTWAGHLCLSLNGVSVTRQLEDGLFSGCVQNGLGTVRGTLTGLAAAELACGVTSDVTAHFATESKPASLPPQPFAKWGANAALRWKEWKARAE